MDTPRRVAILGSTGSVGRQALQVIQDLPGYFQVVALAAGANASELARQVAAVRPRYAWATARTPELDAAIDATGAAWLNMD
ncbi:MAG: 1-deoxy-D-xylulose-5-phosphate reductoisomerase, partial [Dehalococcoidia bacterium]